MKGRVLKGVASRYEVYLDGKSYLAFPRKKLLQDGGELLVGDFVELLKEEKGISTIEKVYPRKNRLIRPAIANIDTALIVIAKAPEPEKITLDKIILNCLYMGIEPVLCYNKTDIADDLDLADIIKEYESVLDVLFVSAEKKEGLLALKEKTEGRLACFVGSSAVGKTTLLNALLDMREETGDLSRIARGKNTTRKIEIYVTENGMLADTCGFSMLDSVDIKSEELKLYYPDFEPYLNQCKFNSCNHISEPECKIIEAVKLNRISEGRYLRYLQIYNEIKDKEKKKYV